ncbi:MAG TPA: hypothetical protein V6D47_08360, partial [Oscillatoriaceae cyanobacterium]
SSKQTDGKGGKGGATPSPGASSTTSPDATGTASPGASSTTKPTAQPTTRNFPAITGAIAAVAGVSITGSIVPVEMLAIDPAGQIPGMLLIPAGDHVIAVSTSDAPTSYDATALGQTFTGARAVVTGGTSTAYVIATVNQALSLITLDLTKLALKQANPASVQSLQGQASNANLGAMAFNPNDGKIYVVDETNDTVDTIAPGSGQVTVYMGVSGQAGSSTSGAVTSFQMKQPKGLAIDGNTLYVADSGNNRILKVDLTGNTATVLAGSADASPGMVDGPLAGSTFDRPVGLFLTSDKKLIVPDQANGGLREVDPSGDGVYSFEKTGASNGSQMLSFPVGAVKFNGNYYALDNLGALQKFVPAGSANTGAS